MPLRFHVLARTALFLSLSGGAWADTATLNAGNSAWVLTATALVLFMTLPGLALFTAAWCGLKRALSAHAVFCHLLRGIPPVVLLRLQFKLCTRLGLFRRFQ